MVYVFSHHGCSCSFYGGWSDGVRWHLSVVWICFRKLRVSDSLTSWLLSVSARATLWSDYVWVPCPAHRLKPSPDLSLQHCEKCLWFSYPVSAFSSERSIQSRQGIWELFLSVFCTQFLFGLHFSLLRFGLHSSNRDWAFRFCLSSLSPAQPCSFLSASLLSVWLPGLFIIVETVSRIILLWLKYNQIGLCSPD